jgi:dihydrofolate reductase
MTRAQYYCAMSLDGFIAEADDTLRWLTGYKGSYHRPDAVPMKGTYDEFYGGVGALVSGSVTYEFVLNEVSEWPYPGKPCFVLTSRELPTPDGEGVDVRFARGAVRDLYAEMADAAGERALWVVGGGNVASQFADAGLLDEVIAMVVPVVLGTGKPLFDRRVPGAPFRLAGTRAFDTGMVELRYEIAPGRDDQPNVNA